MVLQIRGEPEAYWWSLTDNRGKTLAVSAVKYARKLDVQRVLAKLQQECGRLRTVDVTLKQEQR